MFKFLTLILLCAISAYLWSDHRKLLEQRFADAMRVSQDKDEEAKSKSAQALMGKQLFVLDQEWKQRMEEAEGELKRRAMEIEGLKKTEANLRTLHSSKDKEIVLIKAGLEQEKEDRKKKIDMLEKEKSELLDRVSEYGRRLNDTNHTDEVIRFPQFLIGSPLPLHSHRKHGVVDGSRESEAKMYNAYSVPIL